MNVMSNVGIQRPAQPVRCNDGLACCVLNELIACSLHFSADGLPNWNFYGIKIMKTVDIDSQVVRCHALSMKRVNSTDLAKEVSSGFGVKLIFGQRLFAGYEFEVAFMDFHHQRVLTTTDRTIARSEFREVRCDLEMHCATVTAPKVFLQWSSAHFLQSGDGIRFSSCTGQIAAWDSQSANKCLPFVSVLCLPE